MSQPPQQPYMPFSPPPPPPLKKPRSRMQKVKMIAGISSIVLIALCTMFYNSGKAIQQNQTATAQSIAAVEALTATSVQQTALVVEQSTATAAQANVVATTEANQQALAATEAALPTNTPLQLATPLPASDLPKATSTTVPSAKGPLLISRSEFGSEWPFTVENGIINCIGQSVIFTVNGVTYGVNGSADATKRYRDIRPIWTDNPDIEGLKLSLGPIVTFGLKRC